MAVLKTLGPTVVFLLIYLCVVGETKIMDNKTNDNNSAEVRTTRKISDSGAFMFADELKQTLEKYLFGICPQSYKMPFGSKGRNATTLACDLDDEQQDLAGKLATLALRAHAASRSDCTRFGVALANTLGELARIAASRHTSSSSAAAAAANEASKKRKLSKSQKLKIQAKQKTALAVKKKAAAVAAAAAAKMTS